MRPRDMQVLAPASPRRSAAYQLTPIWERVVRTRRLPAEVDLTEVFEALRHRLRDPEREVRQHALRVLADLVPVVRPSLDARVAPLLPDLLLNLGHPAPAVRKGALDALKIYLSHSEAKQTVLSDICTKCLEKNSLNDETREDVTVGLILALPSLLLSVLRYTEEPTRAISTVVKSLSAKLLQAIYQEVALRSMLKLREALGAKEFEAHVESLDPRMAENFHILCDVYVDRNRDSDGKIDSPVDGAEDRDVSDVATITVDVDESGVAPEGKVILETEFAFDSDTAITMTILEEELKAGAAGESEDDSFDYATYNRSLVRVLTDSEQDEGEASKKTPRRVRFGGEVVKMRTPDSDNVQNSDGDLTDDSSKNADGLSGKRSRSMIPLPTLPIRSVPKSRKDIELNRRKSRSLNDLSSDRPRSPRRPPPKISAREDSGEGEVEGADLAPPRRNSRDEDSAARLPVRNRADYLQRSPIRSPRRIVKKTIRDTLEDRGFPVDDLSSGQSGNSSTGSGSSSDNAYEDFAVEDLGVLNRDPYKDLFKMGDDRAVLQAIERLTREVSSSAAAAQAIEPQIGVLAARLASLGARGRSGVAATGLLRALLRSARPAGLRAALPRLAPAIAAQGTRGQALTADLARRLQPEEIIDILLNQSSPHWKSSKLRAGALRVVAHLGSVVPGAGGTGSAVGTRAARAAAGSCRHPRRRVRAAALDALAALAHLAAPRAVLAALHHEAADRNDGDQLYDAVFARLCRSEAEARRPTGAYRGTGRTVGGPGAAEARPDLAWVMAGSTSASPPSVNKHSVKKLETSWARSAPDLPALVASGTSSNRGPHYSFSAARKPEQDKGDRSINALVDARVLTAPPAGVTLRPLVLQQVQHVQHVQHAAWPRQGLSWPQQPAPPWTQNPTSWSQQQPAWTSLSASWGGVPSVGVPSSGGGSWPQRRPPPQLRVTTPPPNRPKLQPLSSHHNSSNWNNAQDDDGSSILRESEGPASLLGVTREHEGFVSRSPQHSPINENHIKNSYKLDELDDDTPMRKSENGHVRGDTSPHDTPASAGWRSSASSEHSAPSPQSPQMRIAPQQSVDEVEYEEDPISPSDPTVDPIREDAEDDRSRYSEERTSAPSTAERRFINDAQTPEEVEVQSISEYNNEERFINMKPESPQSVGEREAVVNKLFANDRSPAHSVRSQGLPVSARDELLTVNRATLNSAPAIQFLGSSVSMEEEVKSVESAFSEISIGGGADAPKPVEIIVDNEEIENHAILGNKISPTKKTPKRAIPKALSSKISRNKIQPVQDGSPSTILPFEKPKEALTRCLNQLESSDWETVMTGLQNIKRLVKCHPALMESQLSTAARAVAQQINNLRSQVARSACQLAGDMFCTHRKAIEPEADELATSLLQKTADTNKFLKNDANDALDKMCESIAPHKSISILIAKGAAHQNAAVKCASARLLAKIAKSLGSEKLYCIQKDLRDRLFQTGAKLLTEGSQETRGHAKQLFAVLAQNPHFFKTVKEVIPVSTYRNIEKTLNSLRS